MRCLNGQSRNYQSNLAGSADTDLLMLVLEMISEIPPVVNSNVRLGVFFLLFKVEHALVELHHYALKVKVKSCSVVSNSLQPHGIYSPWNSPGQITRVGSLSLLQGIFLTQGSNLGLLHCRRILYQLSHQGRPLLCLSVNEFIR